MNVKYRKMKREREEWKKDNWREGKGEIERDREREGEREKNELVPKIKKNEREIKKGKLDK